MTKFLPKHITLFVLILFLAGWTALAYYLSPVSIVEYFGLTNGYAAVFILAFFGGLSTFIVFPYYLVVATFGAGGLNPFLLGLAAGAGVSLGDSISYLIGYHGHEAVPPYFQKVFHTFCNWCLTHPYSILVPAALFLYGAVVPFPNDLIVISMGLARYSYRRLMIPLGAGNVVFNTGIAFMGAYGFSIFQ